MLWRGVYPYEYIDDWEKFNETSLPEKEKKKGFYGHLNTEDIAADADYFKKQFKKIGRIPCFVCLKPYIIVNWCI